MTIERGVPPPPRGRDYHLYNQKNPVIPFRVTLAQKEELEFEAASEGVSLSEYIRRRLGIGPRAMEVVR